MNNMIYFKANNGLILQIYCAQRYFYKQIYRTRGCFWKPSKPRLFVFLFH